LRDLRQKIPVQRFVPVIKRAAILLETRQGLFHAEEFTVSLGGSSQGWHRLWRIENRFGDLALVCGRETNDLGLLDGPASALRGVR